MTLSKDKGMLRVCMLSVCYNSYAEALEYLSSIDSAISADTVHLDLYFIDNSSERDEIVLRELRSQTFLFNLHVLQSENLGYFPSAVAAVEKLGIELGTYDYTIICNVDLIMMGDFFSKLKELELPGVTGSIAPTIYSKALEADRNPKITVRPSRAKLQLLKLLFGSLLTHLILRVFNQARLKLRHVFNGIGGKQTTSHIGRRKQIYAGHGSFLVLTKNFFRSLGRLDYPVFLFGEELYIGESCNKFGLEVLFIPELVIHDSEHVSTGLIRPSAYRKYNADALDYILDRFYS